MSKNGDGWKGAVYLDGLIIGRHHFSYPLTRLSESEIERAKERAKTIKRCRIKWCNNVLVPHGAECAFHLGLGGNGYTDVESGALEETALEEKVFPSKYRSKSRRYAPMDINAHWAELAVAEALKKVKKAENCRPDKGASDKRSPAVVTAIVVESIEARERERARIEEISATKCSVDKQPTTWKKRLKKAPVKKDNRKYPGVYVTAKSTPPPETSSAWAAKMAAEDKIIDKIANDLVERVNLLHRQKNRQRNKHGM